MKEDFLYYIWQFKKFTALDLTTTQGEKLQILNSGQRLQQSGPDFFTAQILIDEQKWAGNVEIHVKSSDWYLHGHEQDRAYDNVILHVVWEHDIEVLRKDQTEIPVLELKNFVEANLLKSYTALTAAKTWINCENELKDLNSFVLENWKERLFFERLERKAIPMLELAKETNNDWEAVLFCFLAKNFGLKSNGESFFEIARSLPFTVVRKEAFEAENLEALLMGRAGFLNKDYEDVYAKDLQHRYAYMAVKHTMRSVYITPPEFFRHRPDNFPTIRLSQLAQLYHTHQNLFAKLVQSKSVEAIYDLLQTATSTYWEKHYRFEKESNKKRKKLTKSFIDLLIINTVVPLRFAYAKSTGAETGEELLQLIKSVQPEKNTIIDKFRQFKMPVDSAYDTQSLLQLKNEYCNHHKCMQCAIGIEVLKK